MHFKQAAANYEMANADEISDHLLNKDITKFWRAWNSTYKKSLESAIKVAGSSDPIDISATFYYSNIYINFAADANAFDDFNSLYNIMSSNSSINMPITVVELLEKWTDQLKLGKAARTDRLVAEHIVIIIIMQIYIAHTMKFLAYNS